MHHQNESIYILSLLLSLLIINNIDVLTVLIAKLGDNNFKYINMGLKVIIIVTVMVMITLMTTMKTKTTMTTMTIT